MSSNYKTGLKIGMLGGGQLGRMLIQEAINLNLDIAVLDPDKDAPCKNLSSNFEVGSLNDFDSVANFGKDLDILTIEIEHVNIEALEISKKLGSFITYLKEFKQKQSQNLKTLQP